VLKLPLVEELHCQMCRARNEKSTGKSFPGYILEQLGSHLKPLNDSWAVSSPLALTLWASRRCPVAWMFSAAQRQVMGSTLVISESPILHASYLYRIGRRDSATCPIATVLKRRRSICLPVPSTRPGLEGDMAWPEYLGIHDASGGFCSGLGRWPAPLTGSEMWGEG